MQENAIYNLTKRTTKSNITLKAAEILEKQIQVTRNKYPLSLRAGQAAEVMNCDRGQVYQMLARNEIPGAKKIKGLGWRIPRDVFLSWWYGNGKDDN